MSTYLNSVNKSRYQLATIKMITGVEIGTIEDWNEIVEIIRKNCKSIKMLELDIVDETMHQKDIFVSGC